MIEDLPIWIEILFVFITLFTVWLYWLANLQSGKLLVWILILSILHAVAAYLGFYSDFDVMPPRFLLVLLPSVVAIAYGLSPKVRRRVLENRDLQLSPFVHTIRIPVEIVLLFLFYNGTIPVLMTFEGRNLDILAGITAPIMGSLYLHGKVSSKIMLVWNIICLGLVSFILTNGILSAPLPFQQFGFDQPNIAVAYFPFVLLPAIIVPLVIYTHLIDIMLLVNKMKEA
ncbi:MAG: hypothetical protein AAF693_07855 [Bacteroidota bacterium]